MDCLPTVTSKNLRGSQISAPSFRSAVQFVTGGDLLRHAAPSGAMEVSAYRLEQFLNASNPICSG